jgi:uncharacterized membrane protein YuzA (DUF378 family)
VSSVDAEAAGSNSPFANTVSSITYGTVGLAAVVAAWLATVFFTGRRKTANSVVTEATMEQ